MGKATIISHVGHGQYTVDIEIDVTYLNQIKKQLEADYSRLLFKDKTDAEYAVSQASATLQAAQDAVDMAMVNYNLDPTPDKFELIQQAALEAVRLSGDYRTAKNALDAVNTRLDAIRKRITSLTDNDQQKKRDVIWCVDLADGKKDRKLFHPGDVVATLEHSGQQAIGQNLQASYDPDTRIYDSDRDGIIANQHGLTPFEFLYAWTMQPPWQTWKHPYRTGIITGGNPDDGWTVRLDNTTSIDTGLPVNGIVDGRTLDAVHAQYMNCGDWAFGIGDHVVLKIVISGAATATVIEPTIIGFVEKPKKCLVDGFGYYALYYTGTPAEWQHISAANGAWTKLPSYSNDLTAHAFDAGSDPTVRSWIGLDIDDDAPTLEFIQNGDYIYLSGTSIATRRTDQSWRILGSGLSQKRRYLYAIFGRSGDSTNLYVGRKDLRVGTTDSDDVSTATVNLTGSAIAGSTINGAINIGDDALLMGFSASESKITASLSVDREWIFYGPIALGAHAVSGLLGGKFSFNASCTRALSMWDFTHGALRTPQATPVSGCTWADPGTYPSTWKERLELTIEAPDARTLDATGIAFANYGRQGGIAHTYSQIETWSYSPDGDAEPGNWTGVGTTDRRITHGYSGTYQIDVGFIEDTEIGLFIQGVGETVITSTDTVTQIDNGTVVYWDYNSSSAGSRGLNYSCPALGITAAQGVFSYDGETQNHSGKTADGTYYTSGSYSYSFTDGEIAAIDLDAALVGVNNRTLLSFGTGGILTQGPPAEAWSSSTEVVKEFGVLIAGTEVDASSVQISSTPSYDTGLISDTTYLWDIGEDIGYYESLWSSTVEYAYDWTGVDYDFAGSAGSIAYPYLTAKGARSAANKTLATWSHQRNPSHTTEYGSYLTGGNLQILDELADPVIYRAIHAV
jgi:hypothetical protein